MYSYSYAKSKTVGGPHFMLSQGPQSMSIVPTHCFEIYPNHGTAGPSHRAVQWLKCKKVCNKIRLAHAVSNRTATMANTCCDGNCHHRLQSRHDHTCGSKEGSGGDETGHDLGRSIGAGLVLVLGTIQGSLQGSSECGNRCCRCCHYQGLRVEGGMVRSGARYWEVQQMGLMADFS